MDSVVIRRFRECPTVTTPVLSSSARLCLKSQDSTVGSSQYRNAVASGQLGDYDLLGILSIYVRRDATALWY